MTGAPIRGVTRRRSPVLPWLVATVLLAAAAVGMTPRPAAAHAVLVSSTPGDGAELDAAPTSVTLEFSEPVSADLGGLRVFDSDGERVDRGASAVEDRTLSVDLTADLPDGAYVATYRIVSADGHPVQGGMVFTVGDAEADTGALRDAFGSGGDRPWEIAGAVARWLAMAGALTVIGTVAFLAWCRPSAPDRLRRLLVAGASTGSLGMVAAVPVQAALATGQGAGSLFEEGVLGSVLGDGFGLAVALGVGGLVLAAVTAVRAPVVAALGSVAALVSFPLVGHTRFDDEVVGWVADIAHVGAAAVWTGGLVALLVTRSRVDDDAERARIVGRFSSLATVAIVAVGVAGLVLAWTEVKALDALTSTTYGWVLLAKVAIVALVAAAGAYNHFRLVPAVVASPADPAVRGRLTTVLRAEVVGLALAVAATAALVNITPAYVDAGIGQIHSEILDLDDAGSVQLVVDPNQAGTNSLHLYFYDPDGRPAEIAEDVRIDLAKPGDDIGPISRTPYRAGPAHFQWDGAELVSSGRWEITVVARIDRFSEETATADVLVG